MKLIFKIFLLVFVTVVFSFTIYSMSIMYVERQNLEKELNEKIKYNEKLFKSSISHILYEVDRELLKSLIDSIYQDKEIVKIHLIDYTKAVNFILGDDIEETNLIKSEVDLNFQGISLGVLELFYTKKYMQNKITEYEKNIFVFSIIFTIILLNILFYFINKTTSSLEKLSEATDKISQGNLEDEINIKSNDEIGLLSKKFDSMRQNLLDKREQNEKQTKEISTLNEEMFSTQKILIETLGQVVEKRYVDDPYHIKRVAQMSYIMAIHYGLSIEDAKTLKIVSPMHDVGKIGISDAILLKNGKLTEEEFEVMKDHSQIGYDILKDTHKETLDIAALVAYEHHEKWDGTGYPRGLKGDEITVYGRITAIIDVFDALSNKRCYKDAWDFEEIKKYIIEKSGIHFDPKMVQLLLENWNDFVEIQNKYKSK